ncbi:MAG TPA: NTP transferase domain-containing protein [Flexivirga sp.]|uniref:cytidylyltransferase domain-containing protein n=1 Tax=Flexivirga sp. TaxID=1962927 RepID=UPI002C5CC9D2|nr:NTP transferase domain-containing protein [Flexivirga sp.]HWC23338.1 NTP transferase domain-containing protein [Flexivirga sp.]
MRVRVVLQSRLSSSRLPGKALLTLAGRPLVVLAAQRAANTGLDVVVATSVERDDDALAVALESAGVAVFRGDLHDTLGRFVGATDGLADDDLVVRLTGDNVGPDGTYVEELIARMREAGQDYVRVTTETIYGMGAEVFTAGLLREADRSAETAYDREHVTPWIRRHTDDFTWVPPVSGAAGRVRCTVDTLLDFTIAARALATVPDVLTATWRQLLDAWVAAGGAVPEPLPWISAGRVGVLDAASASQVLEQAALSGATYIRVTDPESATRLGRALRHGLSERVGVVAELTAGLPDGADAAVWETLARLGSSAVDVVVAHSPVDLAESRDTLLRHQKDGRVRLLGCGVLDESELDEAMSDRSVGYLELPWGLRESIPPEVGDRLVAIRCADLPSAQEALRRPGVRSVVLPAESPEQITDQAAALRAHQRPDSGPRHQ